MPYRRIPHRQLRRDILMLSRDGRGATMVIENGVIAVCKERWNLIVVLGPTASGKTRLAVRLARKLGGEILSADSRQVYRGMDLGTGKDVSEYSMGGDTVPVHLIDICNPTEEFSVFKFHGLFHEHFRDILRREKIPILVGGTGLYLDSVLRRYRMPSVPFDSALRKRISGEGMEALRGRLLALSPRTHNTTDLIDRDRLIRAIEIATFSLEHPDAVNEPAAVSPLVIGIRWERSELRRRITVRLKQRLESGMVDEVRSLHERGIEWGRLESFGLEYRFVSLFLQGKIPREEMVRILNIRIHQFAKRQETWFRKMERCGVRIHWIEGADEDAAMDLVEGLAK